MSGGSGEARAGGRTCSQHTSTPAVFSCLSLVPAAACTLLRAGCSEDTPSLNQRPAGISNRLLVGCNTLGATLHGSRIGDRI